MRRDLVEQKLTQIFRDVFAAPELTIGPRTTASDVKGWDSLSHINLILAVERGFNIRFATREVRKLENVGDLMEIIEKKAQ